MIKKIAGWAYIFAAGIGIVHLGYIVYRFFLAFHERGYIVSMIIQNRYDQLLIIAFISLWIVWLVERKFAWPWIYLWFFPIYGLYLGYVFRIPSAFLYVEPIQRSIFLSVSVLLSTAAYGCAVSAGLLSLCWAGFAVRSDGFMQKQLAILMQKLLRLSAVFLTGSIFFTWFWSYRTQGLLFWLDQRICINVIIIILVGCYMSARHIRGVFGPGSAAVSIISSACSLLVYFMNW